MADSIKCPKCGSDLSENAKFCDQCGASTKPDAPGAGAPAKANGFNWVGLVIVVIVLGAAWWLLFGPQKETAAPAGGGGSMAANPHGGGGMQNPHGGGSGGAMANPHGGDASMEMGMGAGEAHGGGNMDDLMANLETAKTTLDEDPLHVESMQILYQSYGMIGRSSQLRPRLDTALEEIGTRLKSGEDTAGLSDAGKGIAVAAVIGGDPEGAVLVIEGLKGYWPDDKDFDAMIGDIYSSSDMFEEGITSYDAYLANDPPVDEMYWAVRVKRANAMVMLYEQAGEEGDRASLDSAVSELQAVTMEAPDNYQGWYNLGRALALAGDTAKAVASWEMAKQKSQDEMEQWAAEAEIAKAEGREAPMRPTPQGMPGMQGM